MTGFPPGHYIAHHTQGWTAQMHHVPQIPIQQKSGEVTPPDMSEPVKLDPIKVMARAILAIYHPKEQ